MLSRELEAVSRRLVHEAREGDSDKARRLEGRRRELELLQETISALLSELPENGPPAGLLSAAISLVTHRARRASLLDGYGRNLLIKEMENLLGCLGEGAPGFKVGEWLLDLLHTRAVDARGPRPGCLFAAPLAQGGHSGRSRTFVLGLDDARFPGAGRQDPLLLDGERGKLSRELPTAASRLSRRVQELSDLFARVRGRVTLSYCCRDVREDRATFPSSAVWSAYRILSGEREGDHEAMLRWLPEPALSFAPLTAGRALEATDWWLWRLGGDERPTDVPAALAACFPRLGRGFLAKQARESELFTEYDGYVPEAGAAADPVRNVGVVLSASRLETMGRCPLEYFLKYVLEVQPPEEYVLDPEAWLNPADRGELLHSVFCRFMKELAAANRSPHFARDRAHLQGLVQEEIRVKEQEFPPHNREAYARECQELARVADVFLREEESFCRENVPVCFEAAIGLVSKAGAGLLDCAAPVEVELPDGTVVRACGLLDRVDLCPKLGDHVYGIWDYKTGSSRRYLRTDPFRQGRHLQNTLYLALAQARLEQVRPGAAWRRLVISSPRCAITARACNGWPRNWRRGRC